MMSEKQSPVAQGLPFAIPTAVAALVLALVLLVPRALILHRSDFTRWPMSVLENNA